MAQEIRFTKGKPPRSGPSPLSQKAMLYSRKHEELVTAIEFTIYGVYELARKHIHPSTASASQQTRATARPIVSN